MAVHCSACSPGINKEFLLLLEPTQHSRILPERLADTQMVHNSPCETEVSSAFTEAHNRPPFHVSRTNQARRPTSNFCVINFILSFRLHLGIPHDLFPTKMLYALLIFLINAACPTRLTLFGLITPITVSE